MNSYRSPHWKLDVGCSVLDVLLLFDSGCGAMREHSRQRSVTEEQQSQKPNAAQPSGRRFFLAQTSLLAPYRPLKGMRVARASSGPKIPRRKRGRIYETGYLAGPHAADGDRPR